MKTIFTLILALFSVITYGQVLTQISSSNSTIVNSTYSIDFDGNGNVYVGTLAGVYMYNKNTGNSANLSTTDTRLVKYYDGKLIAGGLDRISMYNGSTWTNYSTGTTSKYVNSYLPVSNNVNGYPYFGGTGGVGAYDGGGNYIVFNTSVVAYNSIHLDSTRRGSTTDWSDHLWYTAGSTIVDHNLKTDVKTTYSTGSNPTCFTPNKDFTKILYVSQGYLRLFDVTSRTQTYISGITGVTFACYDNNNNIWYSTVVNNVVKLQRYDGTNITHTITIPSGVRDLKFKDGVVYVATGNSGLLMYDYDATPVVSVDTDILSTIQVENASYQWYYSSTPPSNARTTSTFTAINGAVTSTYQASDAGYYKVEIVQTSGTNESNPVLYGTITTTGTAESILPENDLTVYPNPNTGSFYIKTSFDVTEVTVTNQLGQSELVFFDGNGVATTMKGLVIVTIKTDKGVAIKKVVIQ
jgi:hypothetical protein